MALLWWAMPEQIVAALERQIDTLPTRADAMLSAERIRRVAELEAQPLDPERRARKL
jgi:hypothetical protein